MISSPMNYELVTSDTNTEDWRLSKAELSQDTYCLKVLMRENAECRVVGDDESGPEDEQDDFDLECESPQSLRKQLPKNVFRKFPWAQQSQRTQKSSSRAIFRFQVSPTIPAFVSWFRVFSFAGNCRPCGAGFLG